MSKLHLPPSEAADITLREAQSQVHEWITTVGVRYFNELTNLAILTEEVGELARLMARRYGEQSEKPSDAGRELGDEMADVLWVLMALANQTGGGPHPSPRRQRGQENLADADRHKNNPKLT